MAKSHNYAKTGIINVHILNHIYKIKNVDYFGVKTNAAFIETT